MATIRTHILGFPRIGAQRELKLALESYWRGAITSDALEQAGRNLRQRHWQQQADAGLDFVSAGDFSFYDHVADHIQLFGCEPARFGFADDEAPLARYFAMARGGGGGQHALPMTRWFDTHYHYLVPEFSSTTTFTLHATRLLDEVKEARALGHAVKATLLGPLTFLWLGQACDPAFDRLDLLDKLLPAYCDLLVQLKAAGAEWVQLDEPILGTDLAPAWRNAYEPCYWQLGQAGAQLMVATYFSPLEENLSLACRLPVAGLHVDGVRARHELVNVCDWLPVPKVLSVGIVDGRNVWRTDLDAAVPVLQPLLERRGGALWIAPSCSLLHVPLTLAGETSLDPEVRPWLAFAEEKLAELETLKRALAGSGVEPKQAAAPANIGSSVRGTRVHGDAVAAAITAVHRVTNQRRSPLARRQAIQQARLGLPAFPTTTIGSFQHLPAIRGSRAQVRERNEMIEYFGEQLDGFAITRQGWVQSCGTRCVKPPLIF